MPAVLPLQPVQMFHLHSPWFPVPGHLHRLHKCLLRQSAELHHLHKRLHRLPADFHQPHICSHHLSGISFLYCTLPCCCLQYQHLLCSCSHQKPVNLPLQYTGKYRSAMFLHRCLTGKHQSWHLPHQHQIHCNWKPVYWLRHKEFWFHRTESLFRYIKKLFRNKAGWLQY